MTTTRSKTTAQIEEELHLNLTMITERIVKSESSQQDLSSRVGRIEGQLSENQKSMGKMMSMLEALMNVVQPEKGDQGDDGTHRYTQYQGIVRYKGRICVGGTGQWRRLIVKEMHDSEIGGHSCVTATYQRVKKVFHWPKLKEEIHHFIKSCHNCQVNKVKLIKSLGLLQPLPIPAEAWSSIGMDFISGLPKSRAKKSFLW